MTDAGCRRAGVFAHYDRRGEVADYVAYYLGELLGILDHLVFVSTADLNASSVDALRAMGIQVICRENVGHDFCSYKAGIEALDLKSFDELVLCNDSVYGPFSPLTVLIERADGTPGDLLGLTSSTEIAAHLQSYFLLFRSRALHSVDFTAFWADVTPLGSKRSIVEEQEVGLSRHFSERGFSSAAIYENTGGDVWQRFLRSAGYYLGALRRRWWQRQFWSDVAQALSGRKRLGVNPTHADWRYLLQDQKMPFLKVELLRDNPRHLRDLDQWPELVASLGDYPLDLINTHLHRARS